MIDPFVPHDVLDSQRFLYSAPRRRLISYVCTLDATHFICSARHIHMRFIWINRLIHSCQMTYLTHNSICIVRSRGDSFFLCNVTHSSAIHDTFKCDIWLIYLSHMTYLTHTGMCFISLHGTWFHLWDMTHWCEWHDFFVCVIWIIWLTYTSVSWACKGTHFNYGTWLIHACDTTFSFVSYELLKYVAFVS